MTPAPPPQDAASPSGPEAESAQELLDVAVQAARTAGAALAERFAGGDERPVASKSSPTDLVSEADLSAERAIRELLADRRPQDGFLGEEGSDVTGTSGLRWVVDPLDGTINFLFGIPQWCVSVAVEDERGALAGAIFDPGRDELFTAVRGGRAHCNGRRVVASGRTDPATAMLATGFAYDAAVRQAQARVLERVVGEVRDVRRFGSAALDLAWTASGRYDAYFERTVKPWDIAAGTLICESAGLVVAELPVHPDLPWGILVGAAALVDALLPIVGAPAEGDLR